MSLEHAHTSAEGVVETIPARFDPKHHPNECQIEKEDDVRNFPNRKRHTDNRSGGGNGPSGRHIEPLPPDHDAAEFAAIKVREGVDVAGILEAGFGFAIFWRVLRVGHF